MDDLEKKISQTIKIIFMDYDMDSLSKYERREIIFDYLTSELSYNFSLLEKIRERELNKSEVTLTRNPRQELLDVIYTKNGICNGISQYYKLLLEEVGIESYCVICDDGTEVKHQLNLVHDEESNSYSFDDVTSVIVGRGTKQDYFDYDVESANKLNQGTKPVYEDRNYFILPETYVNYLIGRDKSISPEIEKLPKNIKSIKQNQEPKIHKS